MNAKYKNLIKGIAERACYNTAELCVMCAVQLEVWGMLLAKKYYYDKSHPPTVMQFANRLIEFVDSRWIVVAYNAFIQLVNEGVPPEQAFVMITGSKVD